MWSVVSRPAAALMLVAVVRSAVEAQVPFSSAPAATVGAIRAARTKHLLAGAEIDSVLLARAYDRAAELPRLHSLLVRHRGRLVGERYFRGATRASRANIKSASKSIVSLLVGIAISEGRIRGIDQTIGELLPAETRGLDARKRGITVEDLLSMRAGLETTSFYNYGAWVSSRNWVRDALRRPLVAEPGGPMIYSTGSTHLLSAILTRATGMSTYRYAERRLAHPLGIALRPWRTDPQGIYFGGNDMYLTPREMLELGTLYLDGGVAKGRQIVPRAWVDSSAVPRTVSPFNGNRYGYGWWIRDARGHDVIYAWGYGGQFIFVVPSLELVVVTTSDPNARTREPDHLDAIYSILDEDIMPAVEQAR
jgi:CubicO group peptidase (beta-lactamase class C family)